MVSFVFTCVCVCNQLWLWGTWMDLSDLQVQGQVSPGDSSLYESPVLLL
jgi:hypothetical protein